ncbi:MAG: inorganic pyrophosphatase [Magnetovibrio sp.]|nr:inorganic pyrophosphatase [Magnetovibrio sp.]|tara:strand:- start:1690 stop:2160 length:471 start_codon:yes stop_codon:yes gene_type:complete
MTDIIIEIPYNSFVKYEYDPEIRGIRCDRILHTAMAYPGNYGYIPNTKAGDGDPLDVLLISEYALYPMTTIKVNIIGALLTEDEKGMDEKLIAIPIEKVDPNYKGVNDIEDLPVYTLSKIKHFFNHYKDMEKNKWVKVGEFKNKQFAEELIKQSIQ